MFEFLNSKMKWSQLLKGIRLKVKTIKSYLKLEGGSRTLVEGGSKQPVA